MKRHIALFAVVLAGLLACSALLFPGVSYAAGNEESPRILTVTGRGQLEVKPDTAVISLGVSELKPTAIEAYAAMSEKLQKVAEAVMAMGIKEEQIQTSLFTLAEEYDWTEKEGRVLKGFRASNTLSISTQDLDKVADIVHAAITAGANQMNGISFMVKDADKLLEQVLDMAVDDAKAKAERVASRLGTKVVRVQSVSINDGGTPIIPVRVVGEAPKTIALDAVSIAPVFGGTTEFSASVYVTFEIE